MSGPNDTNDYNSTSELREKLDQNMDNINRQINEIEKNKAALKPFEDTIEAYKKEIKDFEEQHKNYKEDVPVDLKSILEFFDSSRRMDDIKSYAARQQFKEEKHFDPYEFATLPIDESDVKQTDKSDVKRKIDPKFQQLYTAHTKRKILDQRLKCPNDFDKFFQDLMNNVKEKNPLTGEDLTDAEKEDAVMTAIKTAYTLRMSDDIHNIDKNSPSTAAFDMYKNDPVLEKAYYMMKLDGVYEYIGTLGNPDYLTKNKINVHKFKDAVDSSKKDIRNNRDYLGRNEVFRVDEELEMVTDKLQEKLTEYYKEHPTTSMQYDALVKNITEKIEDVENDMKPYKAEIEAANRNISGFVEERERINAEIAELENPGITDFVVDASLSEDENPLIDAINDDNKYISSIAIKNICQLAAVLKGQNEKMTSDEINNIRDNMIETDPDAYIIQNFENVYIDGKKAADVLKNETNTLDRFEILHEKIFDPLNINHDKPPYVSVLVNGKFQPLIVRDKDFDDYEKFIKREKPEKVKDPGNKPAEPKKRFWHFGNSYEKKHEAWKQKLAAWEIQSKKYEDYKKYTEDEKRFNKQETKDKIEKLKDYYDKTRAACLDLNKDKKLKAPVVSRSLDELQSSASRERSNNAACQLTQPVAQNQRSTSRNMGRY